MIKIKSKTKDSVINFRGDTQTEKLITDILNALPELEGNKSQAIRYAIVRLHREITK